MANAFRKHEAGFTLVELIIVIVVIGVVSAYAAMRGGSPGAYTVPSQAQTMASDLRHAQTLATTIGKSLSVTIASGPNGSYTVSCTTSVTPPCGATGQPMTNPVTGAPFTVALQKNVALTVTSGGPLVIDSLGRPSGAVGYRLTAAPGVFKDVNVAAVTGFVSIP